MGLGIEGGMSLQSTFQSVSFSVSAQAWL